MQNRNNKKNCGKYMHTQINCLTQMHARTHTYEQAFISLLTHGQILREADMPTSQPKMAAHMPTAGIPVSLRLCLPDKQTPF